MIELQKYWDNILHFTNDIAKSKKSILHRKKQVEDKSKEIFSIGERIKELKLIAKEKEMELSGREEQLKKLEKRKDIVKNEKEVTALGHEYDKANSDRGNLENELIEIYDSLEQNEKNIAALKAEYNNIEKQTTLDIKELEEIINRSEKLITENQQSFDGSVDLLSPAVKTKFLKLIKSQNGKAIGVIEGEICSACNFQIPFNLIQDASKENNFVNCTNCGRFLYKM